MIIKININIIMPGNAFQISLKKEKKSENQEEEEEE
jgi:hypothetical protein